jgi:hypothetical protein
MHQPSHFLSIALQEAVLCEKCRRICRSSLKGCANCGRTELLQLAGLLEGTGPDGLLLEVEQSVWLQRVVKRGEVC